MGQEISRSDASWAVSGAAMVALCALGTTSKAAWPGLAGAGVLIVVRHFISLRLSGSAIIAWAIRVGVFLTLIALATPTAQAQVGSLLFDPGYTNLFGYICVAELVIRLWTRRAEGASNGVMILLTALILVAATNTYEVQWIRILTPAYMFFVVLILRGFRQRARGSVGWVMPMMVALLMGLGWAWAVATYESEITRWSTQYILARMPRSSSIGLGRSPRLASVFNPYPSPMRILKMENWPGEHHLRAAAFEDYAGGVWGPALDQRSIWENVPVGTPSAEARVVKVTRYVGDFDLLPVPLESEAVLATDAVLQRDGTGSVRTIKQVAGVLGYTFSVGKETHQGVVALPIRQDERARDLAVPREIDGRVKGLAEAIVRGMPREFWLAALSRYLQAHHHYSLSVKQGEGDPASNFLLSEMDANCSYFAAGMVFLAREVGIPARAVMGYYAHEPAGGNIVVVRQRDAHAWAECWMDGIGWMTVDATPAGGRPDKLFNGVPWYRRVTEWVSDATAAVKAWLAERTLLQGAVMIAGLAAIPVVLRVLRDRNGRALKQTKRKYEGPAELVVLQKRFEGILRRKGTICPPQLTWQEYLAGNAEWLEFIRLYNQSRFSPEALTPGRIQTLRRLLVRIEKSDRNPFIENKSLLSTCRKTS